MQNSDELWQKCILGTTKTKIKTLLKFQNAVKGVDLTENFAADEMNRLIAALQMGTTLSKSPSLNIFITHNKVHKNEYS